MKRVNRQIGGSWSLLALLALGIVSGTAGSDASLKVVETAEQIRIESASHAALVYHKAVQPPPAGVDELFARSGFIHPLRTPRGGTVTSIHAPDHYHHMGLWHAWVKTKHDQHSLDFWNIGDGSAGIRFKETQALREEGSHVGFTVEQEHFARREGARDEVILWEALSVRAQERDEVYLIDYDTRQRNVSEHPLELEAYRYGGPIAYRGPLHWDESNSAYLTSEGHGREKGHATRARWVAMTGPTEVGPATVAIFCHPENRDAPQRVRIWPEGTIFFNYVPAQEHAFVVGPDEEEQYRYRLAVFDGEPDLERLEALWHDSAQSGRAAD